jgi:hypothetical protein
MKQIECFRDSLSLTYSGISMREFHQHLHELVQGDIDSSKLASFLAARHRERFDEFIDPGLLDKANAADRLDLAGAREAIANVLDS